jgi:glycosyltransferase involved in cell wall biosynthesis
VCYLLNNNIIHFYNNLGSPFVKKIISYTRNKKIILHEHGTIWNARQDQYETYKFNCDGAAIVLANSNATKHMLMHKLKISGTKIIVIHNGIEVPSLLSEKKVNKVFTLGYIGRIDSHKGVHIILAMLTKYPDLNVHLKVAGDGNVREKLVNISKDDTRVEFIGRINDSYDFINNVDILLVPSIREPLGNVLLEAGLCETVVIASCIDGIPEIIDHGKNGILIKPSKTFSLELNEKQQSTFPEVVVNPATGQLIAPMDIDIDVLYCEIKKLREGSNLREILAVNLKSTVMERFTINHFSEKLIKIYQSL